MTEATAPAKLILCGEHAVVYGCPAIALPLESVRTRVRIADAPAGSGVRFHAPDMERTWLLAEEPDNPLSELATATAHHLGVSLPPLSITIRSDIPIASGMGSGAAVATALIRAIAQHMGHTLAPATLSALVYRSEQRYHGTPSGIDNAVIAYEQAIWFVRPPHEATTPAPPTIEPIAIAAPLTLVIGDTGIRCETRLPVGEVRRRWQAEPAHYTALFGQVEAIVREVRATLAQGGTPATLGTLLNRNQALLEQIGVSSPELERLVAAARAAGAAGAKLSGGGWGGIMLALTDDVQSAAVAAALMQAGATHVMVTRVQACTP
jgi:mevalonate kinase